MFLNNEDVTRPISRKSLAFVLSKATASISSNNTITFSGWTKLFISLNSWHEYWKEKYIWLIFQPSLIAKWDRRRRICRNLRECRIELTDPQGGWAEVTEAVFRVDWNGEAIFERACGTIPRGPVELETWTHPFAEGDALECHFLCTGRYGLRYDFILCKMLVGEPVDNQERYRPVLIWPKE